MAIKRKVKFFDVTLHDKHLNILPCQLENDPSFTALMRTDNRAQQI